MSNKLVLHSSFVETIDRLPRPAQDEIGVILKALEDDEDHKFRPQGDGFDFAKDPTGLCVCSHVDVWGYWQLTWYCEISWNPVKVQKVIVRIDDLAVSELKAVRNSL